ncbi:hypothetical protein L596_026909 [Steinernema carpocapsae]|uniref:Uncharacterized protein n=1 Tax=Steinernema carpocapsae TaxID=34508 RepID=A0A4U5M2R1_STECR|nr:hypothetical protein L596_026909 [Steinernema carpocapsae]
MSNAFEGERSDKKNDREDDDKEENEDIEHVVLDAGDLGDTVLRQRAEFDTSRDRHIAALCYPADIEGKVSNLCSYRLGPESIEHTEKREGQKDQLISHINNFA